MEKDKRIISVVHEEGCTTDSLTINGIETIDMPLEEVKGVIKKLIDKTDDIAMLQDVLIRIIDTLGEYEDTGYCEQCGDYGSKYTLRIQ